MHQRRKRKKGRPREKQRRLGRKERQTVVNVNRKIKEYRIFNEDKNKLETKLNDRLINHLKQNPGPLTILNKNIPAVKLVTDTFRPEFFIGQSGRKDLCAVECKRLTEHSAKARLKEGLSQALLYSTKYKVVFLVLFDFTKKGGYAASFGRGNTPETRFAAKLRRDRNLYIVALKPAG